jgi:hypothetical protein
MNRVSDYVLYFPSIEFQNDNWVKSSLLFWDKIYRIVPEGYEPRDSTIVSEARECDLIRDINLEKKEVRETGDYFLDFFERAGDKIPVALRHESYENLNCYIHKTKVDNRLYRYLDEIEEKYYGGRWFNFPSMIGKGYMFCLASVVSKNRGGMSLSTDNPDFLPASTYFAENGNIDMAEQNMQSEGFYSALILKGLMPVNLSDVSIKDIIEFVDEEKYKKEKLRDKLREFSSELSHCESPAAAKELVEDYRMQIEKEKDELKRSISTLNILRPSITTFLMAGLPIATGILKYLQGNSTEPFDIYSLGNSISIGALSTYKDLSDVKSKRKENSYATYLLDVNKTFNRNDSNTSQFHRKNVRAFKNFIQGRK